MECRIRTGVAPRASYNTHERESASRLSLPYPLYSPSSSRAPTPLHDRSSTGTLAPVNGDTQQQHQQHLSHNGRAPHTRSRKMSTAGRGRRRKAPSISPSSAPPLPSVLHAHHAALRRAQLRRCATGAAVGLRQGPAPPHRSAGEGSAPRCGGSSRANPTLPQRTPAPASRADRTHSRPPSRRTGRS